MSFPAWMRLCRLHRPIGIWLLWWPCAWGVILAATSWHESIWALLCLVGAILMRSAGCVINDLWDRDIDARVRRTQTRPLASGEMTVGQALIVLIMLLLCAALMLLFCFNRTTILMALFSMPLVILYPLAKRWTQWPQIILGLTFAWGVLVGWVAVRDELSILPVFLYLGTALWVVGYDTIYAHQDREDDARVGVKSLALALGGNTRMALIVCYGGFAAILIGILLVVHAHWLAIVAWAGCLIHLTWQIWRLDMEKPTICAQLFQSNQWLGLGVAVSLFLA
jgi:4-hydroxybenzoate polyprenyltransferase